MSQRKRRQKDRARSENARLSGPVSYESIVAEGRSKSCGPEDLLTDEEVSELLFLERQYELPLSVPDARPAVRFSSRQEKAVANLMESIAGQRPAK